MIIKRKREKRKRKEKRRKKRNFQKIQLLIYICYLPDIGMMVSVFAYCQGGLGSTPGRVIPKTLKMVLDTYLLNTQQYKVRIKGKLEQSRKNINALLYFLV